MIRFFLLFLPFFAIANANLKNSCLKPKQIAGVKDREAYCSCMASNFDTILKTKEQKSWMSLHLSGKMSLEEIQRDPYQLIQVDSFYFLFHDNCIADSSYRYKLKQ